MNCINTSSTEFKDLLAETGMDPFTLEMSITAWQQDNITDEFPAANELIGVKEVEGSQTPVFFQEPSLNTIAEIETELLRSPGIKR